MDHYAKRFGGIGRLYGKEGLDRIRRAHVCVVGLGGVGSWAVEALARSGLGSLTLVDLDDVCVSNVNRQLHALDSELGRPKVEVMARRVRAINPDLSVHPMQAFFLKSNADEILQTRFDYVLDAFDSPSRKCVLIALVPRAGNPGDHQRRRGRPARPRGGGGDEPGVFEPRPPVTGGSEPAAHAPRLPARQESIWRRVCALAGTGRLSGGWTAKSALRLGTEQDLRIDCNTGFGTASFVTGTFGFVAAARIVQGIAGAGGG